MTTSRHKSLKKGNPRNATERKTKLRKKIHPKYYKLRHKSLLSKRKIAITLLNKIRLKKRTENIKFTISVMKQESCLNDKNKNDMLIKRSQESISHTKMYVNDIDFSQKGFILSPSDNIYCEIENDIFIAKNTNENDIQQKKEKSIVNTDTDDEIFAGPFNNKREWSISRTRRRTLVLEDGGETSEDTKNEYPIRCLRKLKFDQMNEHQNKDKGGFSMIKGCSKIEKKENIDEIRIIDQLNNRNKDFSDLGEASALEKGDYHISSNLPEYQEISVMVDNDKRVDKYRDLLKVKDSAIQHGSLRPEQLNKIDQLVDEKKYSEDGSKDNQVERMHSEDDSEAPQESKALDLTDTSEDSMHRLMIFDPQKFIRQIKKAQNRENNIMKENICLQKELKELKQNFVSVLEKRNSVLEPEKSNLMAKKIQDNFLKLKSKMKSKIYFMKKLQLNLNASKLKQKSIIKKNKHLHNINNSLKYNKKQLNETQKIFSKEKGIYGQDIKKLQSDLQRSKDLYSEILVECKSLTQKHNSLLEINAELNYELKKSNVIQTKLEDECSHLNIEKNELKENVSILRKNYLEIDYNKTRAQYCKKKSTNIFDQFSDFYSSLPARTHFPYIQQAMRDMIANESFSKISFVNKDGAEMNINLLDSPENKEMEVKTIYGSSQCSKLSPTMDGNGFNKQNDNSKINQNDEKYLDIPLEDGFKEALNDMDKCKTKKDKRKTKKERKISKVSRFDSQSSANAKEMNRSKDEKCKVEKTYTMEKIKDKLKAKKEKKNRKYRAQFDKATATEQHKFHTVVNKEKILKARSKNISSREKKSIPTSYKKKDTCKKIYDQELEIALVNVSKSQSEKRPKKQISVKKYEKLNCDHLNYKCTHKKNKECVHNNIGTSNIRKYLNDSFFNDLPNIEFV